MQFLVHKLNIKKFFFSFFYFPTNLIFFVIFIPSTDFIAFPLPCIDFPEKKYKFLHFPFLLFFLSFSLPNQITYDILLLINYIFLSFIHTQALSETPTIFMSLTCLPFIKGENFFNLQFSFHDSKIIDLLYWFNIHMVKWELLGLDNMEWKLINWIYAW